MNIVHQEGLAMPVDQELINIILNEAGNPPPHKAKITAVSLLFKDLSYSAENGGYHPVEIRLISRNDEWYFDYITDFSYMGVVYPELERKLISAGVNNMSFLLILVICQLTPEGRCLNSGNPTLFSITP